MSGGAFTDAARAAILAVTDGRCAGCGRTSPLTCQHRRARGMGGTSRLAIGHPANGVALCGSGTTGCHGWTEHHPTLAGLLGWRLGPDEDPLAAPFWLGQYGWRRYTVADDRADLTPVLLHTYVDWSDLDQRDARHLALATYLERTGA